MPIKQCENSGRKGFKWGDEGVCYTGKDARKNALKQGVAIGWQKIKAGQICDEPELKELSENEFLEALIDARISWEDTFACFLEFNKIKT